MTAEEWPEGSFPMPPPLPPTDTWAAIDPDSDPRMIGIGAVRAEYDLCRQIPGCHFSGDDQIWRFPQTWPTYACFREIWRRQPINIDPKLQQWADDRWAEVLLRYQMRDALEGDDHTVARLLGVEDPSGPLLTAVQRADVAWLTRWRRSIFGSPRGNGKTPPLIRSMQLLHDEGELVPALVICPPQALLSWKRKLSAWAPDLRVTIVAGSAKQRAAAIERVGKGEADVALIAWGNVRYHTRLAMYPGQAFVKCQAHGSSDPKITAGRCELHEKEMNTLVSWGGGGGRKPVMGFRTVIPDEAHWMADPKSKQTRAVWWLMHKAENTWPTTGTLTVNDIGNLWPILHGLDPQGFPVRSRFYDLFARKDFAFMGKGEQILDLRPDTEPAFRLIVEPLFRRTPKQLARPDEPELAEAEFRFPAMSHKQQQIYTAIAKHGIAELADRDLVPANAITAFTRLCQLAGSMVNVEDTEDPMGFTVEGGKVKRVLPSHKITDLMEFLGDEDGQWIVGLNSPTLAELAERKLTEVGIACVHILGGMSYQAKDAAQQAFQRGDARVIFINEAGREAIDLQAAEGIFWMEPNPSYVHREQITGRADRWGQPLAVRQVWSLTPGTVDTRLYTLGLDKEDKHQRIVRDAAMLRWIMDVAPDEIPDDDVPVPHGS